MGVFKDSGWYVVHPAFEYPRLASRADRYGITQQMLTPWINRRSEEEQDRELVAEWQRLTRWAEVRGVTRVEVDDAEQEFFPLLSSLGLRPLGRGRGRWRWRGTARETAQLLRRLRQIPRLSLTAFADDVSILMVRDLSWDSVYARFGDEHGAIAYANG